MDKDTLDQMIVEGIEQRQGPVASEESFVVELTGRRDGWCIGWRCWDIRDSGGPSRRTSSSKDRSR